eukprot:TRINITY_DN2538_c0_g1_i1.p2 TRINITY_DN2538_c0_g1~~TRINITY_DN2538_c0_g1_i1.p2  ORF type:complete len:50 (-),score=0.43 TRINITY_DN2538_c0_g1_i1:238-387(-)
MQNNANPKIDGGFDHCMVDVVGSLVRSNNKLSRNQNKTYCRNGTKLKIK